MKVREILCVKGSRIFSISPEASLSDVVRKLVQYNCGSLVVCTGDNRMVGIITERDILRSCANPGVPLEQNKVADRMSSEPISGTPDDDVSHMMGLMTRNRIRHLPVVEDDKLVGIISIGDIVKAQHDQIVMENHYLKEYIQS